MSCCDICDELDAIKAGQAWGREALTLLLLHAGLQVPGSAPAGFEVDAVAMGASDWISGNQAMTDGPEGSAVVWIKVDLPLAAVNGVFSNADSYVGASIDTDGSNLNAFVYDSGGTDFADVGSNAVTVPDSTWVPVFVSWNTNFSAGNKLLNLYVGDTDYKQTTDDTAAAFSVFLSSDPWYVGQNVFNLDTFVGDMAEFWFDDSYIDFSVEANRRKFMTAGGKPVDVGTDGSTPTGSAPIIYLSVRPGDAAADFCTNRGTGGNFTQNGTLALASTSPSD